MTVSLLDKLRNILIVLIGIPAGHFFFHGDKARRLVIHFFQTVCGLAARILHCGIVGSGSVVGGILLADCSSL